MSNKDHERLYNNLRNETYCRIGISTIPDAGVGVIAIRDIPEGTNPFKCRKRNDKVVYVSEKELKSLDKNVQQYVRDFFFPEERNRKIYFPVIRDGLNSMDISFYLNHSEKPNLNLASGNGPYYEFRTNRKIKSGEELFIDYFQ